MIGLFRRRTLSSLGSGTHSIRIVDAQSLAARANAWDDLVARAVEPHPHFSRHVIEAHRSAELAPERLAFVTVGTGDQLDAMLPFRKGLDITGLGAVVAQPFLSPFMPSSAPLVAGDRFEAVLKALVRGLAEASGGRFWRWPLLSMSGRVGKGLLDAMREAGWKIAIVESFERPVLERRLNHDSFLKDHPHKGRLKDLRRRRRRLAEIGTLELTTATEGEALREAVERFLFLEASGWKGESGSALACHPPTLTLARALFSPHPSPVGVRADTLNLDGRPLAISLALIAGGTACLLKTAYDEHQRAHAPGLVLEAEIVRIFHETGFAQRLDSATLVGSALESLYRERETVAEIIAIPPGGEGSLSIERRVALARFENRARSEAKRLLKRS